MCGERGQGCEEVEDGDGMCGDYARRARMVCEEEGGGEGVERGDAWRGMMGMWRGGGKRRCGEE